MSLHKTLTSIVITSLFSIAPNARAQAPDQASMLANACAACHGPQGSSQGPATPSIAGISREYFIDAMEAFRENARPATVMNRIAKGYNEEQVELLASYFSSLKVKNTDQPVDPALAEKGAALHTTHCSKCHEDGGRASDDDAGILAGQKTPYLRFTISDILLGKREVPVKMQKKLEKVHSELGDEGIEQLLNFYAGQK